MLEEFLETQMGSKDFNRHKKRIVTQKYFKLN